VRLEQPDGHRLVAQLVEAFPGRVQSITLGKPSLEDVFIDRTGHRFWNAEDDGAAAGGAGERNGKKAGRR
jgi:ABC-2 type transport system ATP-binding protein